MPYVRDRIAPASKEHVRDRRTVNRRVLAPNPECPGVRFTGAYDWFRSALVYARRRSYPSLAAGDAAQARRLEIIARAAAVLQDAGCRVDEAVPRHYASRSRREEFRGAYGRTPAPRGPRDEQGRLHAAHAWLLYAVAQAERHARRGSDPAVSRTAAMVKDEAAARLIEWAEEMDADDYGQ